MEKFIPFEKLSKKEKRERNKAKRRGWGSLNPVTRKPPNPKAYNRRKARKWSDDSASVPFDFQGCCMVREMRFLLSSTSCTQTVMTSPTRSSSDGWRTLLGRRETCTRPS